jgi:hypothetical protein
MENAKFKPIAFLLSSIFFLSLIFGGMQWQVIKPGTGLGLALLFFGVIPHLIMLLQVVFVAKDTPSAILMGMFLAFWSFLSTATMLCPTEIHNVLLFVEPGMVAVILIISFTFYRKSKSSIYILAYGLSPLITMLWLQKAVPVFSFLEFVIKYFIFILAIWALVLMRYLAKKKSH